MTGQPFVRDDVAAFLAFLNAQEGPKMHELEPAATRAMMLAMRAVADADPTPLAVVKNLTCPGPRGDIPLRLYDARESRGPGPVLVFYHGGGWVIGNIDTHEPFCTEAARLLDIPVISVDYRMAPEDPWPASPDDCEAAARWVAGSPTELGCTVTALTLGGDSAGGNLTIVTAMRLRDDPAAVPVIAQLPIYPSVDLDAAGGSMEEFADGYLLTKASMDWFRDHYAADMTHPAASPGLFPQTGMPPAVVITASLDPIRDQGRHYAGLLADAGIDHEFIEMRGTIHGFISLRKGVPSANADVERLLQAFRRLLDRVTAPA
jgi:acetyl esterase